MAWPKRDERLTDDDSDSNSDLPEFVEKALENAETRRGYNYELVEPVAVGDGEDAETGKARLTLPGPNNERVTIVGDPNDLDRRLDQILAWESVETAAERRERIAEHPMPDLDDLETIPADEFYNNE